MKWGRRCTNDNLHKPFSIVFIVYSVLNVNALVGTSNQEKAILRAFFVIVKSSRRFIIRLKLWSVPSRMSNNVSLRGVFS